MLMEPLVSKSPSKCLAIDPVSYKDFNESYCSKQLLFSQRKAGNGFKQDDSYTGTQGNTSSSTASSAIKTTFFSLSSLTTPTTTTTPTTKFGFPSALLTPSMKGFFLPSPAQKLTEERSECLSSSIDEYMLDRLRYSIAIPSALAVIDPKTPQQPTPVCSAPSSIEFIRTLAGKGYSTNAILSPLDSRGKGSLGSSIVVPLSITPSALIKNQAEHNPTLTDEAFKPDDKIESNNHNYASTVETDQDSDQDSDTEYEEVGPEDSKDSKDSSIEISSHPPAKVSSGLSYNPVFPLTTSQIQSVPNSRQCFHDNQPTDSNDDSGYYSSQSTDHVNLDQLDSQLDPRLAISQTHVVISEIGQLDYNFDGNSIPFYASGSCGISAQIITVDPTVYYQQAVLPAGNSIVENPLTEYPNYHESVNMGDTAAHTSQACDISSVNINHLNNPSHINNVNYVYSVGSRSRTSTARSRLLNPTSNSNGTFHAPRPKIKPASKKSYVEHRQVAPDELPIVSQLMANEEMWKRATTAKKGLYSCTHCSEKFPTLKDFAQHMDDYRFRRLYNCSDTTCVWHVLGLPTRGEWKRHQKHQHAGNTFCCEYYDCNKSFSRKDSMRRHYALVHQNIHSRRNRKLMKNGGLNIPLKQEDFHL